MTHKTINMTSILNLHLKRAFGKYETGTLHSCYTDSKSMTSNLSLESDMGQGRSQTPLLRACYCVSSDRIIDTLHLPCLLIGTYSLSKHLRKRMTYCHIDRRCHFLGLVCTQRTTILQCFAFPWATAGCWMKQT